MTNCLYPRQEWQSVIITIQSVPGRHLPMASYVLGIVLLWMKEVLHMSAGKRDRGKYAVLYYKEIHDLHRRLRRANRVGSDNNRHTGRIVFNSIREVTTIYERN